MTKLGKYMVYNPLKDKPVKYYSDREKALQDATAIKDIEKTDVLVLQVVNIARYLPLSAEEKIKKIESEINDEFTPGSTYDIYKLSTILDKIVRILKR